MINGPKTDSHLVKKLAVLEPTAWVSKKVPWKRSTGDVLQLRWRAVWKWLPGVFTWRPFTMGGHLDGLLHSDVYFLVLQDSTKGVRNVSVILLFPLVSQTSRLWRKQCCSHYFHIPALSATVQSFQQHHVRPECPEFTTSVLIVATVRKSPLVTGSNNCEFTDLDLLLLSS